MSAVLKVQLKTVWGQTLIYPVNIEAMTLAAISKAKTLRIDILEAAVNVLGHTVELERDDRAGFSIDVDFQRRFAPLTRRTA